jgi:hypothetical protein
MFALQTHRMMASCNLYDLSKKSGQAYPPVPQVYRYFNNSVSNAIATIHYALKIKALMIYCFL